MMKPEYMQTWERLTNPDKQDPVKDFVLMLALSAVLFLLLAVVLTYAYLHKSQII